MTRRGTAKPKPYQGKSELLQRGKLNDFLRKIKNWTRQGCLFLFSIIQKVLVKSVEPGNEV